MPYGKTGAVFSILATTFLASSVDVRAEELCVGAIGSQKLGKCKYEYEAYIENRGCRQRGAAAMRAELSSPLGSVPPII